MVKSYYASVSGYKDELLWAALWLHRATDGEDYLKYATDKAGRFGGIGWAMSEFSWDVKYAGLQLLASQVKGLPQTFACPLLLSRHFRLNAKRERKQHKLTKAELDFPVIKRGT